MTSAGAEDVLITRPRLDPVATPLQSGALILSALLEGAPISAAAAAEDESALAPLFSALLAGAAIVAIEEGEPQ